MRRLPLAYVTDDGVGAGGLNLVLSPGRRRGHWRRIVPRDSAISVRAEPFAGSTSRAPATWTTLRHRAACCAATTAPSTPGTSTVGIDGVRGRSA